MQKRYRKIGQAILFAPLAWTSASGQTQSLRLWYDKPAREWEQTLPLGNGRLGMMPDGGVREATVVLNDITLWSGSPQNANKPDAYASLARIRQLIQEGKNDLAQQLVNKTFICQGPGSSGTRYGSYQVLGNLRLHFDYPEADTAGAFYHSYRRALSLDSAQAECTYVVDGIRYTRAFFTSFSGDVDVIRLSASEPHSLHFTVALDRPERFVTRAEGNKLAMNGQLDNGTDGHGMQYLAKVEIRQKGGTLKATGRTLEVSGATEAVLYLSAGTDYKDPGFRRRVDSLLAAAAEQPYARLREKHVRRYRALYDRVHLNLGSDREDSLPTDQRLSRFAAGKKDNGLAELFFQYGRYLEIASTRPGLLPPNLQGLWANQIHTPWNGDYHLDINVQMNNWPNQVGNLLELDEPLTELTKRLVTPGARTARDYFHADGWVAHVITNVWGYTAPGEDAYWGIMLCGSGWLCDNLWQHYLYSQDRDYLKKIYPVLAGAARFYNETLVRDSLTGWWVTSPSSSPENAFYLPGGKRANVCMGPTIDNQILRELFSAVIEASRLLVRDPAFRDSLASRLGQIPPPGIVSRDGSLMEWLRDYPQTEKHHRHISHLYGLYPAALITPEGTPRLAAAAEKTLEDRGDDGPSWSIAYKMLWWARLQKGDSAFELYRELMRPVGAKGINYGPGGGVYPNLLSAGPPYQIDGNFGGAAAIGEMLVQSHAGYIQFLPALPSAWSSGSFSGLRVRGNGVVSAVWRDHHVIKGSLQAESDFHYRVRLPASRSYQVFVNGRKIASTVKNGVIDLPLQKGETAIFEATD